MDRITYEETVELVKKSNDLLIEVGKLAIDVQNLLIRALSHHAALDSAIPEMTIDTEVAGHA